MADDAPVSLLQSPQNLPPPSGVGGALMSLLAPLVSGGQVTNANDPGAIPAFLAFAAKMAQAGAPTLGPPTPLANALPQAEAAGYGAGMMGRLYADPNSPLARQIGLETQQRDIANQTAQFKLARDKAIWGLTQSQFPAYLGIGAPTPAPGQPGGATPGSAAGPGGVGGAGTQPPAPPAQASAATNQQLAALPGVQKLPDNVRVPFMQMAGQVGMSPDEADLYSRMVMQESAGNQIDPKTGGILTSSAGALGAAQVMPGTFSDMAQKYNIPGSANDLMSNLLAGGHYFHEGYQDSGAHNAVVRYSAGPAGLQRYIQTGQLPPETADYLVKVNAPPGATQVAGPGAPTATAPGAGAGLVPTGVPGDTRMVPPAVLAGAQAAAKAAVMAGQPENMASAFNGEIDKYMQSAPTVTHTLSDQEVQHYLGAKALPGVAYQVDQYAPGTPLAGQFKGEIQPVNPRGLNVSFEQIQQANKQVEGSPGYQNWEQAYNRFNNAMDSLNLHTQVGDEGALYGYAKILDPTAVVRQGRLESAEGMGGLPGWLSQWYANVSGGAPLTDDLRRQLGQIMQIDMSARDKQMLQAVQQGRIAYNDQFDGNYIKRGGVRTAVLSQDEAQREGLDLEGITYQNPYAWNPQTATYDRTAVAKAVAPANIRRPLPGIGGAMPPALPPAPAPAPAPAAPQGGAAAGGAQVQPVAPAPAVAAPGGPGAPALPAAAPATRPTPPGATKNVLSQNYLSGLSQSGIENLRRQMLANPTIYTDADRALFGAFLTNRQAPPR